MQMVYAKPRYKAKSIQERVRATLAAQDKARKVEAAKAMGPHNRRMGQLIARDQRIEDLIDGKVEPRNLQELKLVDRVDEYGGR